MSKRFFILLIILFVLGAGLFLYANIFFIPQQLKAIIVEKCRNNLNREVSLSSIHYRFPRGIFIEGLTIYQKDNSPLLQIDEINFNVLLPALLKTKKIIIPSLNIQRPYIHLVKQSANQWNISDLLTPPGKAARAGFPDILLGAMTIQDALVEITDMTQKTPMTIMFDKTSLRANLSLVQGITFFLESSIPKESSSLQIRGNYQLRNKHVTARITAERFNLAAILSMLDRIENSSLPQGKIISADVSGDYSRGAGSLAGKIHADMNLRIPSPAGALTRIQTVFESDNFRCAWDRGQLDFEGTLSTPRALIQFREGQWFQGALSVKNISFKKRENIWTADARFSMEKSEIQIAPDLLLKGDLAADSFALQITPETTSLQTAFQLTNADARWGIDKSLTGNLFAKTVRLEFQGPRIVGETVLDAQQISVTLPRNITLSGAPQINFNFTRDPAVIPSFQYKGAVTLNAAQSKGLPIVNTVDNLSGTVAFETGRVKSEKLNFTTMGTDIELKGALKEFSNPSIVLEASTKNVSFKTIETLVPSFFEKAAVLPEGQAAVDISYAGPLREIDFSKISGTAYLRDSSVTVKAFPEGVRQLSGLLRYENNVLSWHDITGFYKGIPYTSSGNLSSFLYPSITAQLASRDLKASAACKILNNAVSFSALKGTYLNSSFDVKGDVKFQENSDPLIDAEGMLNLDLKDLKTVQPSWSRTVEALKPDGIISTEFTFRGQAQNIAGAVLSVKARSSALLLKGLRFENLNLGWKQGNTLRDQINLSADFYGGALFLDGVYDRQITGYPMNITAQGKEVDLRLLKQDTPFKKKTLAGKISAVAELQGLLKDRNSYTGHGTVLIQDGHLWDFNLINGIWGALFIPEFRDIVFTDAYANLDIKNRMVSTEDLVLTGPAADLLGTGWMDFDGNLNIDIVPQFKETTILQSKSIKKGPTAFLTQTNGYFNIKITGSLENPQYAVNTVPAKVLQKATGALIEGFKGMLEDIFK